MTPRAITEDQVSLFASGLRTGEALLVLGTGSVTPMTPEALEPAERQVLLANFEQTPDGHLLANGQPAYLRTVAWLAHADLPNDNDVMFLRPELELAAAKINPTHPLVMDWNHSAVRQQPGVPKMIGYWHHAEVAWDTQANHGQGAWGMLATGVMAAWLYPEIATQMLADQDRLGHIRYSMAVTSKSIERVMVQGRSTQIPHNPIFFTLSALNVQNADRDANGYAVIGNLEPGVEQLLRDALLAEAVTVAKDAETRTAALEPGGSETPPAPSATPSDHPSPDAAATAAASPASQQEEFMTPEEIQALQDQLAQLTTANDALTARVAELEPVAARVAELESTNATLTARVTELEPQAALVAQAADVETQLAELTTSRDALAAELATAHEQIATLTEQNATFVAEAEARAAVEAEAARTTLIASRLASLPLSYQTAHAKKSPEAKTRVEAKWADMSDEAWESYKTDELCVPSLASVRVGYVERSEREGALPEGTSNAISARLHEHLK